MPIRVQTSGLGKLRRNLGRDGADDLKAALELDMATETRNIAMATADATPVDTGALQASIRHSSHRAGQLTYAYGSKMPYALRQEYEHKEKKRWMRNNYEKGQKKMVKTFTLTIKKQLRR